ARYALEWVRAGRRGGVVRFPWRRGGRLLLLWLLGGWKRLRPHEGIRFVQPFRDEKEFHPPHFGRDLLENLQPFPTQFRFEIVEARNVSARMRQARNEAASDRIGDERKDNRNGVRFL